jgi:hypothetical protein
MRILPKLFSLPVIVLLAWMGANIYHGNDLFANPFEEQSVLDKAESRGIDYFDDTLENASDAVKDTFKDSVDSVAGKLKDVAEEL